MERKGRSGKISLIGLTHDRPCQTIIHVFNISFYSLTSATVQCINRAMLVYDFL